MDKVNVSEVSVFVLIVLYAGFFIYGYNAELLFCNVEECVNHGGRISNGFIYGFLVVPVILLVSAGIYNS